jgi:hypothetical protein
VLHYVEARYRLHVVRRAQKKYIKEKTRHRASRVKQKIHAKEPRKPAVKRGKARALAQG